MQIGKNTQMEAHDMSSIQPNNDPTANDEAEHGKKSLIGKVKDKAKKLKSKIKNTAGRKNDDKESSHASDEEYEDDEDDATYTPDADTPNPHAIQNPSAGIGSASYEQQNPSAGIGSASYEAHKEGNSGISSSLNGGQFGLVDSEVPVSATEKSEPKYDHGLRAAANRPPSESETAERQHNVPAAAGHPSVGIAEVLQLRDPKPKDSYTGGRISELEATGDKSSAVGENSRSKAAETDDAVKGSRSGELNEEKLSAEKSVTEEKPITDCASGYVAAAKDAIVGSRSGELNEEKLPAEKSVTEEKPITDRAFGYVAAAKDTIVGASVAGVGAVKSALGYSSEERSVPIENASSEGGTNAGGTNAGGTNAGKPSQSWTDWAYSAKDVVAPKLGMDTSSAPTAKVSENQTPTGLVEDEGHQHPVDSTPGITDKFKGTVQSLTDSISSTLKLNSPDDKGETPVRPGVTDEKGEKGVTQMLWESAASTKNAVASSLGYASPSPVVDKGETPVRPGGTDEKGEKGVTQMIWESAASTKNAVASSLGYGSPSPSREHHAGIGGDDSTTKHSAPVVDQSAGVLQRGIAQAKGGAVAAKDSAVSFFQPGHEEAELSEKITQMFSQSKGSNVGAGAVTSADPENTSSTGGVVSRVTDAVSSIFGSKPTTNADLPQDTVHSKET